MLKRAALQKMVAIATWATLFGLSSLSLPEIVQATQNNKDSNSNQGFPSRRIGGGTRGGSQDRTNSDRAQQCTSLMALAPKQLVITTEAAPTLFFCLPNLDRSQAVTIEFTLKDRRDRTVYQQVLTPISRSGIASLKLPTSETFGELETNHTYRWSFSMAYNERDRHQEVEGWIRRVTMKPTLANKLAQASPLERVKLFYEARLWYEALNELAQLKRDRPEDTAVAEKWTQMLASVNLNAIAQVPLLTTNFAPEVSSRE
jgi:hypothetical protein